VGFNAIFPARSNVSSGANNRGVRFVRIERHPILTFERGRELEFEFDGGKLVGREGETVAAALHAAEVRVLRKSIRHKRPRGFFCAIGRCSSCLMTVDGVPNVMTCITPLREGMRVETQTDKGTIPKSPRGFATDTGGRPAPPPEVPLAIVGAGPAGLSAAIYAGRLGVESIVIDENEVPGGQLIKQTHMFFGSLSHYARVRGIDIGSLLIEELKGCPSTVFTGTTVLGLYADGSPWKTLSLVRDGLLFRVRARAVVLAAGASENMLAFENSDLPGVYGAGAVQTLMNVYGVVPGKRVLMVGAGNIGLIVSYQLVQAGVEVAAVIDAMDEIGGYHVHAAKIRRLGIPILTSHTILNAGGVDRVERATIARVDENWCPVEGSERTLDVDTVCLAVGLTPNCELALMAGCEAAYVSELGGRVAMHDERLQTSIPGIFIAGDASGVEEASTAMIEGRLAGLAAAEHARPDVDGETLARMRDEAALGLEELRAGPFGGRPRRGKEHMCELAQASRGTGNGPQA
jgi:sarcosine oxidase subunit alpha